MPSFMRSLAISGAVIFLSSGLLAVPALAQTNTDTAPTTGLQAPPAASTDALPSAPATAPTAAPAAPEVAPPTLGTMEPAAGTTTGTVTDANGNPPAAKKAVSHKKKATATKKKKHVVKKHKATKKKAVSGVSRLRDAQEHLANLGYYNGKLDGLNGPKTKAAIKKFQKEHHLKVDGILGSKTYDALIAADKTKAMSSLPLPAPVETNIPPIPNPTPVQTPPDFYATHPDFYGYYHQAYENPVQQVQPGTAQSLYSRFAKVELTEDTTPGTTRRYNVTLNGLPLVLVDNQPAVIGVSKTFALGEEDVMIFTSYKDGDAVCPYAYHMLVLTASNTKALEIKNCTRGYQAKVSEGTLFVTFPESDDGRPTGNVWRYDHGDLEKL